jgi:hypothetical protein
MRIFDVELDSPLEWQSLDTMPGILWTEYKGHKLTIEPVGMSELVGFIDGVLRSAGSDSFEMVAHELMMKVDGVVSFFGFAI